MLKTRIQQDGRRGVVLIIALGLLALFAAVGISFAVIAKYERTAARNFKFFYQKDPASGQIDIPPRKLAEFGISQLIYDTRRTNSALRGHSLLRDMYGSPKSFTYDAALNIVEEDGADPEALNDGTDKQYIGSYNGTGIFNPLDDPTGTALTITDPDITITRPGTTQQGTIEDWEVLFFLSRLRPMIGYDASNAPKMVIGAATDTLYPLFPFNFMHFDLLGNSADPRSRLATYNPNLGATEHYADNRHPERYSTNSDGTGTVYHLGSDEDYDYPDHNNLFLAMERADGQIIVPSFHRPHLVRQLESNTGLFTDDYGTPPAGVGQDEPIRRKTAWRDRQLGRSLILRPRELEYNASVITGDPQRGNRWRDLLDLDNSGAVGDSPEELDVDTDGDGKKDAIWIDLGYEPENIGGRWVKPLFAFKVLSLDGKINLNAHGNYLAEDATILGGENPSGFGELHSSNLGASTYEVNPKHALLLSNVRPGANIEVRMPDWQMYYDTTSGALAGNGPVEYKALLGVLPGQIIPGRYTPQGQTPNVLDRPGLNLTGVSTPPAADDNVAIYPANEYDQSTTNPFAGPIDLHGLGRAFEPFNLAWDDLPGATSMNYRNLGSNFINYPQVNGNNRRIAGNTREYQASPLPGTLLTGDDPIETNLYEPTTSDSLFTDGDIERLYRADDIDTSALSPRMANLVEYGFGDPTRPAALTNNIAWNHEQYARQRMRRMFTHASWDLNRFSFPPIFTTTSDTGSTGDYSDDISENPTPATPRRVRGQLTIPAGPNAGTFPFVEAGLHTRLNLTGPDKVGDPDPLVEYTDPNADTLRTEFARKIYVLLHRAVRLNPTDANAPTRARVLAQLAVNIVDFMDTDDVMTYLNFHEDLAVAPVPTDPTRTVFGFELPRVVVNEVMVYHYQHNDGSGGVADPDQDTVWAWVELHNPWDVPVDLRGPNTGVPYAAYQLKVADLNDQSAHIVDLNQPMTSGDPNFTENDPLVKLQPTANGAANIPPGGYVLIGPPGIDSIQRDLFREPQDLVNGDVFFQGYKSNLGGQQNNFTAMQLKYLRFHRASTSYEIGLYRLRNPHQAWDEDTNPYIQLDHASVTSSETTAASVSGGAWAENIGVAALAPEERVSHKRVRLWTGESRDWSGITFPNGSELEIANFLGTPDFRVPLDGAGTGLTSGYMSSDSSNPHTLLVSNPVAGMLDERLATQNANVDQAFISLPFLNRRVATPLELLSVRLYGSHRWPDHPNQPIIHANVASVVSLRDWKLRFTDDYGHSTMATSRAHRDRVTPWLEDSREIHPVNRSLWSPPVANPTVPMLPDLFRFFEFVECRSRNLGSEVVEPNTLYPRRVRVPGKISLNAITDEEVFRALFDDPWVMPSQRVTTTGIPDSNFSRRHPMNFWEIDYDTAALDPVSPLNPTYPFDPRHNLQFQQLFGSSRGTGATLFRYGSNNEFTALDTSVVPPEIRFGNPQFPTSGGATVTELESDDAPERHASYHRIVTQQWPGIHRDSSGAITGGADDIAPGRDPEQQVHSEMFRMFLLSRAGADGITGTGDDKPFRSFASARLSDTILRQRNYTKLDGKEGTRVYDPANVDGSGEYLANLYDTTDVTNMSPSWTPRLFDPVTNPLPIGAATALSTTEIAASIGEESPADFNAAAGIGPIKLPGAAIIPDHMKDAWMLEHERNRLLGKIAGNVTTRSHVYACWMTVGFFDVERGTENAQVPCLNEEIGIDDGTNVRHRMFFIVDRSKATKYEGPPATDKTLDEMASEGILTLPGRISFIE